MTNELNEFLDEVNEIAFCIWDYLHQKEEHILRCTKRENMTNYTIEIYSEDHDYLTGAEIESCIEIANSHQKTCFNTWYVKTTSMLVETKKGNMVTAQTPMLVILIYQRHKEETEEWNKPNS